MYIIGDLRVLLPSTIVVRKFLGADRKWIARSRGWFRAVSLSLSREASPEADSLFDYAVAVRESRELPAFQSSGRGILGRAYLHGRVSFEKGRAERAPSLAALGGVDHSISRTA